MPPKKQIPAVIHHPILGPNIEDKAVQSKMPLYVKKKMSPEEYVDLMSGRYGHSEWDLRDYRDALKNHPYDNPKMNDKVVKKLLTHIEHGVGQDPKSLMSTFLEEHGVSEKALGSIIENPEKYGIASPDLVNIIKDQKSLSSKNIDQILESRKSFDKGSILRNESVTPKHVEKFLSNPKRLEKLDNSGLQAIAKYQKHQDPSKRLLDDKQVEEIVRHNKQYSSHTLDMLVEGMPQEKRSEIFNDVLGISGGKPENEIDETMVDPSELEAHGYQNWENGDKHNSHAAKEIAESKYISPNQIDHIKRHGNFQQKYNLFSNPNIDVKHAQEMYSNWINNDEGKGYHEDDLKDQLKDENKWEDVWDDYDEEAREEAEESYPMSAYLADADDEYLLGEQPADFTNEKMGQYDWNVEDPKTGETVNLQEEGREQEHPEYEKRLHTVEKQLDDALVSARNGNLDHLDDRQRDHIYEGYDDSIQEDRNNIAHRLYEEDQENFHIDYNKLPKHLKGKLPDVEEVKRMKMNAKEIEARKEAKHKEAKLAPFLDKYIPKRDNQHEYGDMKHHLEMAKDYADANGGQIDIGHMNKLFPNLKEKWKAAFGGKGKISSQELEQKVQELPKTKYDVSYGNWDANNMQNVNGQNQTIVRLDHSPESLLPIKNDEKTHNIFRKIQEVSQRSGHPTNHNTIGWARVDMNNPKHWMIDETQSDFGSAARDYLKEHGKEDEAGAIDTIMAHHKNWREALINKVIDLAKKNGVEKVSTHSPESKAAHTGASNVHSVYKDSYQKVPRSMGFYPVPGETLPLTDEGQSTFRSSRSGRNVDDLLAEHLSAMDMHAHQWAHNVGLMEDPVDERLTDAHAKLREHHYDMYKAHSERLNNLDPSNKFRSAKMPEQYLKKVPTASLDDSYQHRENAITNAKHIANQSTARSGHLPIYGFDSALKEEPKQELMNQGHTYDISPQITKKSIDEVTDLMKSEVDQASKTKIALTLKTIKDNQKIIDELAQSNPNAYNALMHMVESMVSIFKKKTGEDPEALVQQLEIEQEAQAQQEQLAQQGAQQDPNAAGEPNKDQPIHNKKLVYGPGAERRYSSQDDRIKDPTGEWHAHRGGIQFPDEGEKGQLDE